jgi:glycosyltransferase involved in cell wall biosynthesis
MTKPDISVIICTHNPRADYFSRVLDALRLQTLSKEQWELLLIDNASKEKLTDLLDLSWHPHGKIVREDEIGLTPARLRGIKESSGGLLIFVDDDNVLAADYLANGLNIAEGWPMLGAFGASISGEFETPPPDWINPYLEGLAIRELDRDYWCNLGGWSLALPYGAGLCIRRQVAADYLQKASTSEIRKMLGRSGAKMGAGEDHDLAECALDIGLGVARFTALKILHLIPKSRLTADYVVQLYAGFAVSDEILSWLRPNFRHPSSRGWRNKIWFLIDFVKANNIRKKIMLVQRKARKQTHRLISTF